MEKKHKDKMAKIDEQLSKLKFINIKTRKLAVI
jgi:hypothetical protein